MVEDGAAKLSVNYGYVKPKLEQISLQEYVIAFIRILNCLIQDGQISKYSNLKDYLAYLIKSMELAMRYEWRSVLEYDDHFRQLQALYGLPFYGFSWMFESHHIHTTRL